MADSLHPVDNSCAIVLADIIEVRSPQQPFPNPYASTPRSVRSREAPIRAAPGSIRAQQLSHRPQLIVRRLERRQPRLAIPIRSEDIRRPIIDIGERSLNDVRVFVRGRAEREGVCDGGACFVLDGGDDEGLESWRVASPC